MVEDRVPNSLPAAVSALVPPDAERLLIEQMRIAFWNILIVAVGFAIGDLAFRAPGGARLLLLNLAVIALALTGLLGVRQALVQTHPTPFALLMLATISVATAAAGIVRHDATGPPLLLVVLTLGVGGIFAWDVWPQVAVAIAAGAAIAWNVHTVHGHFGTFGHDAIFTAVVVSHGSRLVKYVAALVSR